MVARARIAGALATCAVLLLWWSAATASAKPGQVDTRYGFNGTLDITDALPGSEFERGALAAAAGPLGESVVLSYAFTPCPPGGCNERGPCASVHSCGDLYLTRVSADGVLDTAFAARAGRVATVAWGSAGAETGPSGAIAVQPDGKVVVAAGDGTGAAVVRLNPDGSRDLSFRNPLDPREAGQSYIPLAAPATVTELVLRPNGEAIVSGAAGGNFFVSQLGPDGQADSRFAIRGTRFENFQPGETPADVALRGDSVLVGGQACCERGASMAVAAFDPAGSLFAVTRVVLPKRLRAGQPKGIASVVAGPKGSIFVVGSTVKGTFVAKYLRGGRADKRFRDEGFALVRGLRSEPRSALCDGRGRIVLFGTRRDVPDTAGFRARYVSTARLLPNGRVDPTYGGVRPLLVVEEGGQRLGLDINRSLGVVEGRGGMPLLLGEAAANRYARAPSGPSFGLVRFLAGGRLP